MFKILFLWIALLVASSQGRPSYLPLDYGAVEYSPSIVGYESLALPAAVSHQSSTVVHEKRPYWRPVVKSYTPYSSPLVTYDPLSYGSAGWQYDQGWNYPNIYLK
ncbi:uncharacterized protein [Drosophila tropicalis]|uniref:uncharacterized protein n=1 Tax=Drosophila tropicalis TaxID=46794 RepID=UPI0035ABA42F